MDCRDKVQIGNPMKSLRTTTKTMNKVSMTVNMTAMIWPLKIRKLAILKWISTWRTHSSLQIFLYIPIKTWRCLQKDYNSKPPKNLSKMGLGHRRLPLVNSRETDLWAQEMVNSSWAIISSWRAHCSDNSTLVNKLELPINLRDLAV